MPESESNPTEKAPRLTGIVPVGSDMSGPIEPVNPLVRLALQFFVIPMAMVLVCVGLVFVFQWLTYEKKDLTAYLSTLSSAARSPSQKEETAIQMLRYIQDSKQWQGIYDVTKQLQFNREAFLKEYPDFPTRVTRIFRESSGADRRVRQYLAQVLGLVGGPEVVDALIEALEDSDSETVIHSMMALGQIGDKKAIPHLIRLSQAPDRGLRQTAVFVLGHFQTPEALQRCGEALNDPDVLVVWNAAFGLARQSDARAQPVLEQFLDSSYIEGAIKGYPPTPAKTGSSAAPLAVFHPDRLEQYRATGVRLLGQYPMNPGLRKRLETVAGGDGQLKVRQAAMDALRAADAASKGKS